MPRNNFVNWRIKYWILFWFIRDLFCNEQRSGAVDLSGFYCSAYKKPFLHEYPLWVLGLSRNRSLDSYRLKLQGDLWLWDDCDMSTIPRLSYVWLSKNCFGLASMKRAADQGCLSGANVSNLLNPFGMTSLTQESKFESLKRKCVFKQQIKI